MTQGYSSCKANSPPAVLYSTTSQCRARCYKDAYWPCEKLTEASKTTQAIAAVLY